MRQLPSWWLVPTIAMAAACGKAADKPADSAPADTAAAAAASGAPAGPQAIVTVIYNQPKDTAAFEKYYAATHLPLVSANQAEIGFTRADLTKFTGNLDGKKASYYRQAELYFPSLDAAKKGMATPGFKKVADDLANFATGGLTALVAVETSEPAGTASDEPAAIVTVIYNQPKDTAAFEKYYAETHLPLVGANQAEIGFRKAELTKFESSVDGSAPKFYRQAELYFDSMDALRKGTGTSGFKKVADDLANFATGGLTGMTAVETK
ncbi:MAG TPA: EthD family reductase [Phycisphaerales bacterium]|nr:EthD family reductase [Phycisphaerales bacterium]